VDGAIADAIAQGLLLQPKRFVVKSQIVLEDLTKLYGILLKNCDVYMGFKLIPEGYPNWVTVSRAYYDEGYVYVSADPDIHALGDLKPGHAIGATIGTMAHFRLISYNRRCRPTSAGRSTPTGPTSWRSGRCSTAPRTWRSSGRRTCGTRSGRTRPMPSST
jgi:hypothetical protein